MKKPCEIVILSGKGGTGKTSITAAFAAMAKSAVFADCDVDAADLHLLLKPTVILTENFASGAKAEIDVQKCTACGICEKLCRFNAVEHHKDAYRIDEYACEGCGLCKEFCSPGAITIKKQENNRIILADCRFGPMVYGNLGIAEENSGRLVSKIRQNAKEIATRYHADYIIIDGPPGIGCPVISSVTGADLVIAVTEPTLSGWHDLERLIEMIGRFQIPVRVIINKADLNERMTGEIEKKLYRKGVDLLGKTLYDESMVHALVEGKTIIEWEPGGNLAKELNKIWNKVMKCVYEPKSI